MGAATAAARAASCNIQTRISCTIFFSNNSTDTCFINANRARFAYPRAMHVHGGNGYAMHVHTDAMCVEEREGRTEIDKRRARALSCSAQDLLPLAHVQREIEDRRHCPRLFLDLSAMHDLQPLVCKYARRQGEFLAAAPQPLFH